jgi:hypothetical protein
MTNMWEGLGPDHTPTAPQPAARPGGSLPWAGGDPAGDGPAGGIGPTGGGPSGADPSSGGPSGADPSSGGPSGPSRARPFGPGRRRRWTAGLLIAVVAAGGGAFAVAEATGSPAATPISLSGSSATQDASTQAAALSAVLGGRGGHGRLARLRRLGGMYGQFTDETKKGARTLAFERGTIASVASGDVVVRAHDGTTWVWDLTGTSVVRDDGKRTTDSALAAGGQVFVGGPVTGGTRDAQLIVIGKASSGTA